MCEYFHRIAGVFYALRAKPEQVLKRCNLKECLGVFTVSVTGKLNVSQQNI